MWNIWPHCPGALWAVQICKKEKKKKKAKLLKIKIKKSLRVQALCQVQFVHKHVLLIVKMYLILENLQQGKINWMHGCMYDVHEAIYLYCEIHDPWFSSSDLGWGHFCHIIKRYFFYIFLCNFSHWISPECIVIKSTRYFPLLKLWSLYITHWAGVKSFLFRSVWQIWPYWENVNCSAHLSSLGNLLLLVNIKISKRG